MNPTLQDVLNAVNTLNTRVAAVEQAVAQKLSAPPIVQTLPAPVIETKAVDLSGIEALVAEVRKLLFETQKYVLDIKGGNCRAPKS